MPKLSRKDLQADKKGVRPIESNTSSLEDKIGYAWKVITGKKKYPSAVRNNALGYLKKLYGITVNLDEKAAIAQLTNLVKTVPEQLPRNPMNRISPIKDSDSYLNRFLNEVNEDINELNKLIELYNGTRGKPQQIAKLQEIARKKNQIDNKYSDDEITSCRDYQKKIHHDLFLELKKQFASLGINSLDNVTKLDPAKEKHASPPANTLPEILANMSPDKTIKMLEILAVGEDFDKHKLKNLYESKDPGFKEYRHFWANNSISFLGGGNSKNFKISPKDGSPPIVLKVDNRMGMPKSAEAHLRTHSLKDICTPVAAERQVTGIVPVKKRIESNNSDDNKYKIVLKKATRTLLVTDFCSGGDIESYGKKQINEEASCKSAIKIYTQMSTILIGILQDGCAFPDMKNSNWLMDDTGTVRLADTKSFVFTESDGMFNEKKNEERWFSLISTSFMDAPEFDSKKFSADKMHSMLLGKNLYDYLTNAKAEDLYNKYDGEAYNFDAPVFHTTEGKELAILIKSLIKPHPEDRLSIKSALVQLETIASTPQLLPPIRECQSILKAISNEPGFKGLPLQTFVKHQEQLIMEAKTPENLAKIKSNLEEMKQEIRNFTRVYNKIVDTLVDKNLNVNAFAERAKAEFAEQKTPADLRQLAKNMTNMKEDLVGCYDLLKNLEKNSKGDLQMNAFLSNMKNKIFHAKNTDELKEIKGQLAGIKNDPQIKAINDIIRNFREGDTWYSVGMSAKADRIQAAMSKVPIEDRGNILHGTSPEAREVRKALASHRNFLREEVYLDARNEVVEKKAATTFKNFNQQFKDRFKEITAIEPARDPQREDNKLLDYK